MFFWKNTFTFSVSRAEIIFFQNPEKLYREWSLQEQILRGPIEYLFYHVGFISETCFDILVSAAEILLSEIFKMFYCVYGWGGGGKVVIC